MKLHDTGTISRIVYCRQTVDPMNPVSALMAAWDMPCPHVGAKGVGFSV